MGCAKSARSGVCSGWAVITTLGNGSIMGEITSGAISVRSGHTTLPFHVWSQWWYIGRSCQCCPLSLTPLFLSITTIAAVGFGDSYPTQVHHRGASIPDDHHKYQCKEGWKWRDSSEPNPNVIIGAMVAGPDSHDGFSDKRKASNNLCRVPKDLGAVVNPLREVEVGKILCSGLVLSLWPTTPPVQMPHLHFR